MQCKHNFPGPWCLVTRDNNTRGWTTGVGGSNHPFPQYQGRGKSDFDIIAGEQLPGSLTSNQQLGGWGKVEEIIFVRKSENECQVLR